MTSEILAVVKMSTVIFYPEDLSDTIIQNLVITYKSTQHHNPEDYNRYFRGCSTAINYFDSGENFFQHFCFGY
jgi:hypothetical protein